MSDVWKPNPGPQTLALSRGEFEVAYGGARYGGKGLTEQGLILTPCGFRRFFDISVGDSVVAYDGTVSKVLGVYDRGDQPCYRMTFSDGASIDVDSDHLWYGWKSLSRCKADRVYFDDRGYGKIYTTKQVSEIRFGCFVIPLCEPVNFTQPKRHKLFDPYVMGLVLGDGSITDNAVRFSTSDQEIVNYLSSVCRVVHYGGYNYGLTGLYREFGHYGLMGCNSLTKFIPKEYKTASVEDRWQIVRGLMDTDGTVNDGKAYFYSISPVLAEDFRWIIRSLGGKATITKKAGKYRDSSGNEVVCNDCCVVYVNVPDRAMLFNLPRKKEKCNEDKKRRLGRRLVKIEPIGNRHTKCITIDHPSGLFIANDFIVTHNSEAGQAWLCEDPYFLSKHYRALILRKNANDLDDWLFHFKKFTNFSVTVVGNPPKLRFPGGGEGTIGHLKDTNAYEKYQGHQYHKVLLEELTQIPDEETYLRVISSCRGTSKDDKLQAQVFCTFNPGGPGHVWVKNRFVRDCYLRPYKDPETGNWRVFIPAKPSDNPHLTDQTINQLNGLPEHIRRAWRDGEWDVWEGQAFTQLKREVHGFSQLPSGYERWPVYLSGDRGRAKPWSIGIWRMDYDGVFWRVRDLYGWGGKPDVGDNRDPEDVAKELVSRLNEMQINQFEEFVVGPDWFEKTSGRCYADAFVEAFRKSNMDANIVVQQTGQGSRHDAVMVFHQRLNQKAARISLEGCPHFWRTIPALQVSEKDPEDIETSGEDHVFDECALLFRRRQWIPTERRTTTETAQEAENRRLWALVKELRKGKKEDIVRI